MSERFLSLLIFVDFDNTVARKNRFAQFEDSWKTPIIWTEPCKAVVAVQSAVIYSPLKAMSFIRVFMLID